MSEIVDQSLQKIAKGTTIVFIGTSLGMILGFVGRIIVIRYITQSEYGIYSLALVLMNVAAVISILGLAAGTVRQIAFYRGKGDEPKVRGVMLSSLQIAAISSVFFSLVLFFTSGLISINLFHNPELSAPLRIFCIAIPFLVLINIFASIFRGFDIVQPSIYFQHLSRNALFPLLLIVVILLGLPFAGVVYAFVASVVLTFIAFTVYATKRSPMALRGEGAIPVAPVGKELLLFSLPLLLAVMFRSIISWTDTLMLGYFMTSSYVGLYNGALPLALLLPIVLEATNFLYVPIMSQLYAKGQTEELKRSYAVLTKWIFSATLPIFLIFILFPEAVLNILFGSPYIVAAPALRILSVGFFVSVALGPNGTTLMAMGRTRFLMWTELIAAVANVALNVTLIPPLGIYGAAIATAVALAIRNIIVSAKLHLTSRIHPFARNYLKPIIASIVPIVIIYALVTNLVTSIPLWLLLLLFIVFLVMYGLLALLTRSFDKEDITMLLTIEQRLGMNLTAVKRILRRFV